MPTCTEVIGPSSAPATAASMAPSANTPRNSSAHAHQRGHLPVGRAGAQHPARVRVTNQYRPSAAATPKAMIMRR